MLHGLVVSLLPVNCSQCVFLCEDDVCLLKACEYGHSVEVMGADVLWECVCHFYGLVLDDLWCAESVL